MRINVMIDIVDDNGNYSVGTTSLDIEIIEKKNIYPTPLKSYSYSLYNDSEEPIIEGEIHHHDERAGPMQLVRRVINNIKEI